MRIFTGECHYGREILPEYPFGVRELVTRGIVCISRKLRPRARTTLTAAEVQSAIAGLLSGDAPCMVSRFGTIELEATMRVAKGAFPWWSDNSIVAALNNNAGVFPPSHEMARRFGELSLASAKAIDLIGCYDDMPMRFVGAELPQARTCPLAALEPFRSDRPWTAALRGRKVLVVHSMTDTIVAQYARRCELFANGDLLPEFGLQVYRSVNSAMGLPTGFTDWFAALEKMQRDIAALDFEIAILGCGAYGMPLGAFIKRELGRKVVHLGGMTQLLFGIRGRRWEGIPEYDRLMNGAWVRPLASDTPSAIARIEGGCYW